MQVPANNDYSLLNHDQLHAYQLHFAKPRLPSSAMDPPGPDALASAAARHLEGAAAVQAERAMAQAASQVDIRNEWAQPPATSPGRIAASAQHRSSGACSAAEIPRWVLHKHRRVGGCPPLGGLRPLSA